MAKKPKLLKLCVEFSLFPDNTVLGPAFQLGGFSFSQPVGAPNMFVNDTAGERGLQFPNQGMNVNLPAPTRRLTMRVGSFAGPFDIAAINGTGATVAMRTVNSNNTYTNISMSSPNGDIVALEFKGGNNEGFLVKLCVQLALC